MKKTRSASCTLCAFFSLACATMPSSVIAASTVAEMNPAELRALFRQPGLSVPDGLGTYNEDYSPTAPAPDKVQRVEHSTIALASIDRGALCVALGDALNYRGGGAMASRRVAYGAKSGISRWYHAHCISKERPQRTPRKRASVDPVTMKALRAYVARNPEETLNAY